MDIIQLKYFLTVAQYNHMSLAASHLYLSQSSLSKHILQLEKELGLKLFDRTARTLRLTSAGQEFLGFAKEMIAQHDAMHLKMSQYRQPNQEHLTLGTIPVLVQYHFHHVLLAFQAKYPEIQLRIFEENPTSILKMLDKELIDLAILRTISLPSSAYKTIPLVEDALVLAVSSNHPLAGAQSIDLRAAAGEDFFLLDSRPGLYDLCLTACSKAGFSPRISQRFTHLETIFGFVAAGAGVALVMEKSVPAFTAAGIVCLQLREPMLSTLALTFPHGKKLSPNASLFQTFFQRALRN